MFQIAYHTDMGIKKQYNQDALLMKTAVTPDGEVGLFAVCDGMGGLSHGELASATVIRGLSAWFEEVLPGLLQEKRERQVVKELESCIRALNEKILHYGQELKIKLGTTVTAMLFLYSRYYIVQIGDSRIYSIGSEVRQLTKDQTLVALEIERGNLTKEQARKDPRRNILLQCIGASSKIDVAITEGMIEKDAVYMLCTDGFYHEIFDHELVECLQPERLTNEEQMKNSIVGLVELVKMRKEQDNISVVTARVLAPEPQAAR